MTNLHDELETTVFLIEKLAENGTTWRTIKYYIEKLTPDILCSCTKYYNQVFEPFPSIFVFDEKNGETDYDVGAELHWGGIDVALYHMGCHVGFSRSEVLKGMFNIAYAMGKCELVIDESAIFNSESTKPFRLRVTKVDKLPRIDISATIQSFWFENGGNDGMEHLVFLAGESIANHIENFGIENPYEKEDNDE